MVGSVSIEIEVLELPGTEPFYVYKCVPSYSTIALNFLVSSSTNCFERIVKELAVAREFQVATDQYLEGLESLRT